MQRKQIGGIYNHFSMVIIVLKNFLITAGDLKNQSIPV